MPQDILYETYQHYGTHAQRLAFTPAPPTAATAKPIYGWYETDTSSFFVYDTSWHQITTGVAAPTINAINNGRLTTESGVPVSTSDRTAQGTIYFTLYNGNQISLYTGVAWSVLTFSQMSLALSGLTSGKNYDVFIDYNSGTPQIALSAAWASDSTRTDAIALQDGIPVKSGTATLRWVGTIRTTGTTTTEDSGGGVTTQVGGKRFVWNAYNQVPRALAVIDTTNTWTYNTATIRQANGATGNKVEYVTGDAALFVEANTVQPLAAVSTGGAANGGVGVNSTTTYSGLSGNGGCQSGSAAWMTIMGWFRGYPGLGYIFLSWNERGAGSGTTDFRGDDGGTGTQAGLQARIQN